ncbi:MAG: RagB/SusD family nutrient uptake outer membrane protein [Opitutaceae bacterium]|nr:RagB/SusD family nutrient uptake outer membrane protein [Cytophagales bacterium]
MKTIYKTLPLAALLVASGCNKKFLDKQPLGQSTEASYYKTDADMISAVNAAYDPLGWESSGNTANVFFNFFFGDIASDDAIAGGNGSEARIVPYAEFTVNSQDVGLLELWKKYYIGIYRTNLVLTKAPESSASESTKKRVTGEAKFLRAFYYFKLVEMFGDVPLITSILTADQYKQAKTPKSVIYSQIEADLIDATLNLPAVQGEPGRATSGAAQGLLARVSMFQAKWLQTKEAAERVISSGVYALETDYNNIFAVNNKNGKESVFEIQASSATIVGDERQNEGTFINKYMDPRDQGGFGVNVPSPELIKAFDDEAAKWGKVDPRKKATVISNGDTVSGNVITTKNGEDLKVPGVNYYNRKYYVSPLTFSGTQTNGPSNQKVIRLADVYLMAAEAYFNLGADSMAIKYVNIVRKRVNMPLLKSADYSGETLRQAIWQERRIELAMESLRFFDIVRQGRSAELIKATAEGKNFQKGKNEVFPIPQSEIDLSGGLLIQNPSY